MKRIDIIYGGEHYSVGGRDFEELQAEITGGIAAGVHWLAVNDGEGAPRLAYLLLTPGTPIALIPIPGDAANTGGPAAGDSEEHGAGL